MMRIEYLTPERITELWADLEPLLDSACNGNEIARGDICAKDIFVLAQTDMCAVFCGFDDGRVACVLVMQFYVANGKRGADIIALAGRHLLRFKSLYWEGIISWLKANDVVHLDAYTPDRLAKIFRNKFGFNKACSYVRMDLS